MPSNEDCRKIGRDLLDKFTSHKMIDLMGETLFPDERMPWTVDTFIDRVNATFEESAERNESLKRRLMCQDILYIGESLDELSATTHDAAVIRDSVIAILGSMVSSKDRAFEARPLDAISEHTYEADFLEVVRREIFGSDYTIFDGINEGGITSIPSYHDDWQWRAMEFDDKNVSFQELRGKVYSDAAKFTQEEWQHAIARQGTYLLEYLVGRAERWIGRQEKVLLFLNQLPSDGTRVIPQNVFDGISNEIRKKQEIAKKLRALKRTEELMPLIHEEFGSGVTVQTLLDFFSY